MYVAPSPSNYAIHRILTHTVRFTRGTTCCTVPQNRHLWRSRSLLSVARVQVSVGLVISQTTTKAKSWYGEPIDLWYTRWRFGWHPRFIVGVWRKQFVFFPWFSLFTEALTWSIGSSIYVTYSVLYFPCLALYLARMTNASSLYVRFWGQCKKTIKI